MALFTFCFEGFGLPHFNSGLETKKIAKYFFDNRIHSEWLISLKNGLYVPGPASKVARPELMLIANHLWGPSYVSMETALSYWGLIPERVYETTSDTVKRSRMFKTELGRFSYRNSP